MRIHGDVDQCNERIPQGLFVDQGAIVADDAGVFERADTAKAGRRRQPDAVGEILVADASFLLQYLQDRTVIAVDFHKYLAPLECWQLNCQY